jgi:hypothetical protein
MPIAALLLFCACENGALKKRVEAIESQIRQSRTEALIWQRDKDCALQAERVAARLELEETRYKSTWILNWDNHYSAKYQRCFMRVRYTGGSDALYDVFENSQVASCSNARDAPFCDIKEDQQRRGDCKACFAYIEERMKN